MGSIRAQESFQHLDLAAFRLDGRVELFGVFRGLRAAFQHIPRGAEAQELGTGGGEAFAAGIVGCDFAQTRRERRITLHEDAEIPRIGGIPGLYCRN